MGSRSTQPHIVTISGPRISRGGGRGGKGITCCCCNCCSCINLQFLKTLPGALKLAEVILSGICESLLIEYGLAYSAVMGASFNSFLTTAASCFMTTAILLFCYIVSDNSFRLIRSSLFEVVFNGSASLLFLSAATYLAFAVNVFLWPMYMKMIFFQAYPAMSATYILGYILAGVYGFDAYMAYKQLRGTR